MLKVKRDDFYELNNDDNNFDLNDVNNLFKQISNSHINEESDKEEETDNEGEEN